MAESGKIPIQSDMRLQARQKQNDKINTNSRWLVNSNIWDDGSAESGWINLFKDLFKFVTEEELNSVKADEKGIAIGEFLLEHQALAAVMKDKREQLQDALGSSPTVSVTYFQNWASTIEGGLLLHAKPTNVEEVCRLVKKAKDLRLKVKLATYVYL